MTRPSGRLPGALGRKAVAELASITQQFEIGGVITELTPLGIGHINETFIGCVRGTSRRFVFQRINQEIFPDVEALMENVQRVTEHLHGRGVRTLTVIPTTGGGAFLRDPDRGCWRAFPFIENTVSGSVTSSPGQAEQAGRTYGEFARQLSDLPPPRLHETIPGFHDTPKRFADFLAAVEADPAGRAASARAEIEAATRGGLWVGKIADAQAAGTVPERIAHNDAKIENALFDVQTGEAVCVVDLDTVMPGSLLHDFGDLVRSAVATAGEEECELDRIGVSMEIFAALAQGFAATCSDVMTAAERELLASAGTLITYEQALRFLTDHLLGDPYYRVRREGHNLDRARNQLRLFSLLEDRGDEMEAICARVFGATG